MLEGALGHLFLNLDNIEESQRSPYERALHRELFALAQRSLPRSKVEGLTSHALARVVTESLVLAIDLGPGPSDVTRLSCPNPKCPNKRQ